MALYSHQLVALVRQDPRAWRQFLGVFPSDKIPKPVQFPCSMILNLDKSHQSGSHWVAVSVDKHRRACYFDSFGIPPHDRDILNWLVRFPAYKYNDKEFQHLSSQACGYYAVLFVILTARDITLAKIQYLFYEDLSRVNDRFVKEYIKYIRKYANKLS